MIEPLHAHSLPLQGRHLIEASAGTGKTFNIARLYLRLLVERELPVQNILVMTFTRAATAELKGRLAQAIHDTLEHWGEPTDEAFFQHLYAQQRAPRARALLRRAMLDMDEAAVFTIHGFCKRALTQQAFRSGVSFHADMEAQTRALVLEALQDWYRCCAEQADFGELYALWSSPEAFFTAWGRVISGAETVVAPAMPDLSASWAALREAWPEESEAFLKHDVRSRRTPATLAAAEGVHRVLGISLEKDWSTSLGLQLAQSDETKAYVNTEKKRAAMPQLAALLQQLPSLLRAHRAAWAHTGISFAREHLVAAKDRLDQLDFSDLITRLYSQLAESEHGPALAAALVQQYPVALVDEFQDTDPQQYAILDAIYRPQAGAAPLLCMIGDPKQAIYGFRGGDVFAYLQAREGADRQWVMDTNYRSTQGVIRGYNRLFYGDDLSLPACRGVFRFGIEYHPVKTGRHDLPLLADSAQRSDFQWCLLPADAGLSGLDSRGNSFKQEGRRYLARWTAQEIRRLLAEASLGGAPVKPADIAILVRDRFEAADMQCALRDVQLDGVYLSAQDNVLNSREAASLQQALQGILQLEDPRLLVAALATPWLGYDTQALFALQQDEHSWASACAQVAALRQQWFAHGFMKMALNLYQHHLHPEPLEHERALTNGLHLLELLQAASQRHRQPQALLHWFEQARLQAQESNGSETQQLRLESDGDLIRLVTLHGAKGLEYPIVFLPFISYGRDSGGKKPGVVRYHDRADFSAHHALEPSPTELELYNEEQAAENIRLLYVGATRGVNRVYLLAAAFTSLKASSVAQCLGAYDWESLENTVQAMASAGDCGWLQIAAQSLSEIPAAVAPAPIEAALQPAIFSGRIERDWWLSSFSALTRNSRRGGLSTRDRDQATSELTERSAVRAAALRFSLKPGAETGNLLHDLLETLDFQEPDWARALDTAERRYADVLNTHGDWRGGLTSWLQELLTAPLPSGARLADLPRSSTLREPEFYFPMQSKATLDGLWRILARHRGSAAADLAMAGPAAQLKGMMHGFIDLVYAWEGRYYVVDYKSTHLGNRLADYHPAALTADVEKSVYDLQYLIYSLALHRYLGTRLADYDPARHLGGVQYLYLRGLHAQEGMGIYQRSVDLEALYALDAFFQGEEISL